MWRIRSLLFNLTFYPLSALILSVCLPMLLMPRLWLRKVPPVWLAVGYFLEKYVLGLDYVVIGKENIPTDSLYLVAMKHQSAWETMKLYRLFGNPVIVLKKELMDAPLLGRYGHIMDMVPVDRTKGKEATKFMVAEARRIVFSGNHPLVIFPQGTRTAPGVKKPYKKGIMSLYEDLGLPLIPVALNSGKFWGRTAFWKKPGLITIKIMPPIPPGLPTDQVFAMMQEQIETESDKLL